MSSPVTCDTCGCAGRRKLPTIAPEDWYFAEFTDEDSGEVVIAFACSQTCILLKWQRGPGLLTASKPHGPGALTASKPHEWRYMRSGLGGFYCGQAERLRSLGWRVGRPVQVHRGGYAWYMPCSRPLDVAP